MTTQHKLTALLVAFSALLAVVGLGLTGGALADITEDKTVDEFEELELEVVFTGDTTVDVTITDSDGTEVETDTLDGVDGDTLTETYNVEPGDYTVETTAGDTSLVDTETVTVVSSLSSVSSDEVAVDGDEIVTDVEFSANTSALVEITNETGDVVYDERVDGVVTGTDNVFETVTYEPDAAENYTVDVSAEDTSAINETYVDTESTGLLGGGGIIGGAGQTELIGFGLIVGGLVYAYREDMI